MIGRFRAWMLAGIVALLTACGGGGGGAEGGGGGGGGGPTTPQAQTIAFAQAGPLNVVLGSVTANTASGGAGTGATTYVSSNTNVVTVDQAGGAVTALGVGTATITATKAADASYLQAQASYTVHVQAAGTISAFIGGNGASVILPASANGRQFARARVADCVPLSPVAGCANAELSTVTGASLADTRATLSTPAYFSISNGATEGAPIDVRAGRFSNRVGHSIVHFKNRYWVIAGGEPVFGSAPITHVAKRDVWSSADGKSWKLETANAAFEPRWFAEAVVYNDRIWIISGAKLPAPPSPQYPWFEDVWSSADGVNWTLENTHPNLFPWWPTDLDVVVFNGEMWAVSGGRTYSSTNGVFIQRSATPALTGTTIGRSSATLTAYNNQLWYIGGKPDLPLGSPPNGSAMNDVWRSSDGINWTEVLANGHNQFAPRYRHSSFVANGRLWILGGQAVTNGVEGAVIGDAWSTADGITWTQESANALARGYYMPVIQEPGRVTVIGGILFGYSNDVWRTTDGVNWSELSTHAQFSSRATRGMSFNGQMWVIGGAGPAVSADTDSNEIWRSNDGVNWSRVTASGPMFTPRSSHEVVVHGNRMWVIGGWNNMGVRLNDVWSSADGAQWRQDAAAAPFLARVGHASVSYNGRMWIAGGNTSGGLVNDVWSSSDGASWTPATTNAAFSARGSARLVALNNEMLLIGGGPAGSNEIWRSADGATWTQVTTAAPMFVPRTRHAAVVWNGRAYVTGGTTNDNFAVGVSLNDVWSSADGVSWRQETGAAPFAPRNLHVLLVHDNELWVTAGFSAGAMNDVWRSADGVNWRVGFSRDIAVP